MEFYRGPSIGSEFRQALLCGKSLDDKEAQRVMQNLGLLHLLVVSGSHLILLDHLLSFFKVPLRVRLSAVLVFTLISGFQAPAVRSLLGMLIHRHFQFNKTLWTTALSLLLFPTFFSSLSFWLSSYLSLLLGWSAEKKFSPMRTQVFIYCSLLPLAFFMPAAHPISIPLNLLVGGLLGGVWIPLAMLPSDKLFTTLFDLAQKTPTTSHPGSFNFTGATVMTLALTLFMQWKIYQHERGARS